MLITALFIVLVLAYSLVSRRLERTVVTAPILFTAAGAALLWLSDAEPRLYAERRTLLLIAEAALVMVLFTDASRIRLSALKGDRNLPARLLSTGMLLTIALGAAAAMVCLGGLTWQEAGIVAAILAPTDAGLGQIIVSSPKVPARIRQALNVEAGLNDGLSVPFLMLFVALAATAAQSPQAVLARYLLEQLGYGVAIGIAVGLIGGGLLGFAHRRNWMSPSLAQLGVVTLPLLCMIASEESGASMFIAAFFAGLAVQRGFPQVASHSVEFAEDWGQLFSFFVFFLFGMFVEQDWLRFNAAIWLYAAISLTVVRMLPVAVALWGTGLARGTVLFMGWFGPRGLASVVLGLVYLEQQARLPGEETIRLAVMATVLLSIVAHGISAMPGLRRYARSVGKLPQTAPEHSGV